MTGPWSDLLILLLAALGVVVIDLYMDRRSARADARRRNQARPWRR